MSKKLPNIVVRGERHELVVLRVDELDEWGRPLKVSVMYEGDVANLRDGSSTNFVTAFVPAKAIRSKPRAS